MRKASAGIVDVTTTPLFFYLEYCELLYCFIGIIVQLLLLVVALMVVVEYILFRLLVVLAAVVIASVPGGIMVFSRSSCCVGVAEFYS